MDLSNTLSPLQFEATDYTISERNEPSIVGVLSCSPRFTVLTPLRIFQSVLNCLGVDIGSQQIRANLELERSW